MEAANFDVDQGSTFRADVQVNNQFGQLADLTGCVLRGQVRKTASSPDILATFTFTNLNLSQGSFTMGLSAQDTAQLPCDSSPQPIRVNSQFAYDVEATFTDGSVERLIGGILNVSPEVTR